MTKMSSAAPASVPTAHISSTSGYYPLHFQLDLVLGEAGHSAGEGSNMGVCATSMALHC